MYRRFLTCPRAVKKSISTLQSRLIQEGPVFKEPSEKLYKTGTLTHRCRHIANCSASVRAENTAERARDDDAWAKTTDLTASTASL
jgi:hypothetical protein